MSDTNSLIDIKSLTTLAIGAIATYLFTGSRVGQEQNANNLLTIPQLQQSVDSLNERDTNLRRDITILQDKVNSSPTTSELKLRTDLQAERIRNLEEKVERLRNN